MHFFIILSLHFTNFNIVTYRKIRQLIEKDHEPLSKVEYWVNEVREIVRGAERLDREGKDKLAYMIYDSAYDGVPKDIQEEVE